MLRKCLDKLDDESDDSKVNVQVSCACCGSTVKEANIDQTDDNAPSEKDADDVERRGGKEIEDNILRSGTSSSTRLDSCLGCCCKGVREEDERMAKETIDLHTTQTSQKDLSRSQVLRE